MLKVTKKPPLIWELQPLIGRFVILRTPLVHYIADFISFAEITQCYLYQTHKALQTLRAYKIFRESTSAKTQFFTPQKWLWSDRKIFRITKSYNSRIYDAEKV